MTSNDEQSLNFVDATEAIKDKMADGEYHTIEECNQAVAEIAALRERLAGLEG